ncbi:receptor protein-tyrosine kinase ERBB-2 precursor [Enterocytozoon bieneusi H348]|nr:receptor protein-tyrosine kinase ERBB-2 precursor [Enterocytozoon bieneusi H348]|eukprot:XP_001827936.1 receptor protein-tyrosine kinase ERBB-2 precursor [Enterocytozoon bieneusi H348]
MITKDILENNIGFDKNFMRGSDSQFNNLVYCSDLCVKNIINYQKLTPLDKLLGRTKLDKAHLYCNLDCLRKLSYYNCKFKGRWVFKYFLGCTEFMSSLCALIKLIINLSYIYKVKKYSKNSPLKREYWLHYIIMNLAFMSSFLFHLHENIVTRNMDYFTAVGSILANTLVSTQRNILIYFPELYYILNYIVFTLFVGIFILYLYKMLIIDFNYHHNKIFCVILVLLLQINYILTTMYYKNKTLRKKVIMLTNLSILSGLFELSDIPPILYFIDSHFLWHLGLLLSISPFYKFTIKENLLYKNKNNNQKNNKNK